MTKLYLSILFISAIFFNAAAQQTTVTCATGLKIESTTASLFKKHLIAIPHHSLQKKPVEICWKFGDGTPDVCKTYAATYTGTYSAEHAYTTAGKFEACIKIKYEDGCESRKCEIVSISHNTPATCTAGVRIESSAGNLFLKKVVALPHHSQNKKPIKITWKFGDGTPDVIKTYAATYTGTYGSEHVYTAAGTFETCVTIKYEDGCESRKCETITVASNTTQCEVNLAEVATNISNLERKFYVGLMNSRIADKICWTYGDGTAEHCINLTNPVSAQSLITTHQYAAPGNYRVCVKVWYAGGCVVEKCREVIIKSTTSSMCGGYMTEHRVQPKTVHFKGFPIHNPADPVTSFTWRFGDGTTGTGQEVKHEYAAGGKYEVCLTIRTASGCETKICKPVQLETSRPSQLALAPNPVINTLNAVFQSTRAETVTIRIYTANGIVIKSFVRTAVVGQNTWSFDVNNLPSGVYSVVVKSNTQFSNAIFFK